MMMMVMVMMFMVVETVVMTVLVTVTVVAPSPPQERLSAALPATRQTWVPGGQVTWGPGGPGQETWNLPKWTLPSEAPRGPKLRAEDVLTKPGELKGVHNSLLCNQY